MSAPCCSTLSSVNTLVPAGIFIASLLGSLHCVGMCGGLMVAANITSWPKQFLYHLGRGFSYVALGGVAALIGTPLHIQHPYVKIIGFSLYTIVLFMVSKSMWTGKNNGLKIPQKITLFIQRYIGETLRSDSPLSSGIIGILSVLLPCGLLYSFFVASASASSITQGMIMMLAFWLGTIPALLITGLLSHRITGTLSVYFPKVAALLLFLIGILSLFYRF